MRRPVPGRLVVGLAVLVLAASVVNVWLALTRTDSSMAQAPRRPSLAAEGYRPGAVAGPASGALEVAVDVVSVALAYDTADVETSRDRAVAQMTPAFAATYRAELAGSVGAREGARRVVDVVVRGAGLVRVDDDRVRSLVFLDRRLVRAGGRTPAAAPRVTARERVLVDLVHRSGRWLVEAIAPL